MTDGLPGYRPAAVAASVATTVVCFYMLWVAFVAGERVFLLWGVDLGFHELAHLLFAWGPGIIPPLAGSTVQVGIPIGLAVYFLFGRREVLPGALMLAWAGTSAQNASVYIADAPTQYLPLLGGGRHDWAYIFAGHLDRAVPFSRFVWFGGLLLAVAGLALAISPLVAPLVRGWLAERRSARLALLPRREPRNHVQEGEAE